MIYDREEWEVGRDLEAGCRVTLVVVFSVVVVVGTIAGAIVGMIGG